MSSSSTLENRRGSIGRGARRPNWAVRPATPLRRGKDTKSDGVNRFGDQSDESLQGSDEDEDDPMFASVCKPPLALAVPKAMQAGPRGDQDDDESSEDELLTAQATFTYNSRRQPRDHQPVHSSAPTSTSSALMDHVTTRLGSVRVSPRNTRAALAKPASPPPRPPAVKPTATPTATSTATEVVELLDSDSDSDSPSTTLENNPYLATRPLSLTYHRFPTPFSLSAQQLSLLAAFHKHLVSTRPRPPAHSLLNIVHNKYNITLDSLHTLLSPGEWLNDELINGYLSLAHARLPDARKRKVLLLSTFFYTTLANHGYDRVKRWVKRPVLADADDDQGNGGIECVLVPVNFNNRHWALACLWVDGTTSKGVEVGVYDSMPCETRSLRVAKVLVDWIVSERNDPTKRRQAYGDVPPCKASSAAKVQVPVRVCVPQCPEQDDGSSCGVFTVAFAVWVMHLGGRGAMPEKVFGQSKQLGMRRRMAFELCGIGRGREHWEEDS